MCRARHLLVFLNDLSRRVPAGCVVSLTQIIELIEFGDAREDGAFEGKPLLVLAGGDLLAGDVSLHA
jgi:hypothetical protein